MVIFFSSFFEVEVMMSSSFCRGADVSSFEVDSDVLDDTLSIVDAVVDEEDEAEGEGVVAVKRSELLC